MRTRNIWILIVIVVLILGFILFRISYKPYPCAMTGCPGESNWVKVSIKDIFVEDQRVVLLLPNRVAKIKQGKDFGMAFGIQNVIKEQKFRWEIKVNDPDISRKCGMREQEAERWITNGRVGRVEIASGQIYDEGLIRFNIPEGSVSDISTCVIRYELVIREEDGGIYQVEPFEVDII